MLNWYRQKRNPTFHLGDGKTKEASKTFCMLPWAHMHILPNADVLPCCVTDYTKPVGNLSDDSIENVWNSEQMKSMRLNMLHNKPNDTCKRCYELEEHGATSFRQQANETMKESYALVSKTKKDGSLDRFEMHYQDIRFSNLCNLKCVGCSPALSSKWADDFNELYNTKKDYRTLRQVEKVVPRFWEQFGPQLANVRRSYFAGGEPLLMDEHYRCLESYLQNGQEDIPISYNTNLSVLGNKNYHVLDYWPKFKYVFLSISVDDIKERGEYFRFGLKWERLLSNLSLIKEKCPHVEMEIMCTVNIFNIFHLPDIHSFFKDLGVVGEDNFYLNFMLNPSELRTQNLSDSMKKKVRQRLESYVADLQKTEGEWRKFSSDIQKQLDFMDEEGSMSDAKELVRRTDILDSLRGVSVHKAYPEIGADVWPEERRPH